MATTKKRSAKGRTTTGKTKGKIKPHYSPKERGAALALLDFNNGNIQKTASQLKVPRTTLNEWDKGRHLDTETALEHQRRRIDIDGALDEVVYDYFIAMRAKLKEKKTSLYHMQGGVSILLDKRNVLMGRPTAISASLTGPSLPANPASNQTAAYEKIIVEVIADAAARGEVFTRAQAIAQIIELKPEAKEFIAIEGDQPS